ncbi:MocE family 2Fe-2S type ferredoxin [Maliponia aquimaris]|uniref:Naphthalene 1,2-dioxygenase/salicylate 5-hydroxylase systems, ferredoxin component n=1 Tax=Maliponia aquimaris TaxID=1673631 RepID=A0A238KKC7_9RHOB|nr:MocE family 2Fe-2S type ferredoxin [Maliponia aquimaris]SMX43087.1 Naphthalene 1,2-dioxygenase/salicylate 5-hydroxylase systems, ferredoxin component [Maliponia aquimaris]
MPTWIDACAAGDIDAEDVIRFDHGTRTFIIVRDHQDGYYCTDGLCTHEAVHLSDGLVVEATIECPKHSSIFDCRTGEVETPPACENLRTYPTRVEDGRVFVQL